MARMCFAATSHTEWEGVYGPGRRSISITIAVPTLSISWRNGSKHRELLPRRRHFLGFFWMHGRQSSPCCFQFHCKHTRAASGRSSTIVGPMQRSIDGTRRNCFNCSPPHLGIRTSTETAACKAVQPIREASVARFRAGLNLGGKVCERHIEYYMRCRIECLDTNKKINYIICQ